MSDSFQTQRHIQAALTAAGLHPKHRFGQHFLIDRNLMMRLVESADLSRQDTVIEVGAGTGSLTRLLADRARACHAFEIDETIADVAAAQLSEARNVVLHRGDALRTKTTLSPALAALLENTPVKLVANLPYDIATPLLIELLLAHHPPSLLCFTIQREVGERLVAGPGSREYGPASVIVQLYSTIERLAHLPPSAFWPRPKIDSLLLRVRPADALPPESRRRHVAECVRRAFVHRRKTMRHILARWLPADGVARVLERGGIDPRARPEALPPQRWSALADEVTPMVPEP